MSSRNRLVDADLSAHVDVSRVHRVGSAGFNESTRLWNGAVSHRPALVVQPVSTAEIQAVIRFARATGLAVSVLGAGHDWAGRALVPGGVVIDMSLMRTVRINATKRIATMAGGATATDVVSASEPHGLVPVTGQFGGVGMVGLSTAGGYGPLNGLAGLALDNIVGLELVLEDGRAVRVDAGTEPDLFWAARGGGGNFGVVSEMQVSLHRVAEVVAGVIGFDFADASAVLSNYTALIATAPDELTVAISLATGPYGGPMLYLWPTWSGPAESGGEWMRPVTSEWMTRLSTLGRPVLSHLAPMLYSAAIKQLDAHIVSGRHYEMRTCNLPTFTAEAIQALVRAGSTRTSDFSGISIHHFHGAATRVPLDQTAFGVRVPHFLVEILAGWDAGDDARTHRAWAENLFTELEPHALLGGYPNLIGPHQDLQASASYGPNAERLRAVKDRFDPTNVFRATGLPT